MAIFHSRLLSTCVVKKEVLCIGTWNVRTVDPLGKLELLLEELDRTNLDIVGLCETRWNAEGEFKPEDDTTIVYSGKEKGKKELGVAIILRGEPRKALDAYTPVSDRIIAVRLKAKPKPMTIIQVYAHTSSHDEETIHVDRFYEQLQETLDKVSKGDICIIMGDLNAKVRKNGRHQEWDREIWSW